jgi:saxitoxin biosynthesis operon SxtJ-like protein
MTEPTPLWRRLLNGWMAIAEHFGGVQTLVLLGFIYVVVIGPVSLVQTLGGRDQLDKRALRNTGTAWRDSESSGNDLERAKLLS